MGDAPPAAENWPAYLKRMTSRKGWSVARLARDSGINRASIFKWMSGDRGMTVANVVTIAHALGDDPVTALKAAASVGDNTGRDETIELIRTDPRLTPDQKIEAINLVIDQRERQRAAELEQTRRLIDLMGDRD